MAYNFQLNGIPTFGGVEDLIFEIETDNCSEYEFSALISDAITNYILVGMLQEFKNEFNSKYIKR